jgi:2-dehydropantoate 2-reductase
MPDFDQALEALAGDDDGKRIYITVQNGLAAPEMVAALFSHRRVLAGAAVVNADRSGLGEIQVHSEARRLSLAPLRASDTPLAQEIAARLVAGGISAPVAAGATQLLWAKFVGIEPLATTCALTRLTLGEVRRTPHALVMLRGLFEEVFAVGRSIGVPLPDDLYVRRWRGFFEGPEHMRPSLAVDIAERRPHELQWLTGTVVTLAERSKTAAPLHRRALKMLERTEHQPAAAHAG